MASELTIGEYLRYLLGRDDLTECPPWPPDVFACCASLLLKSGSYARVLTDWPPRAYRRGDRKAWSVAATKYGDSWRRHWVKNRTAPARILDLWRALTGAKAIDGTLDELNRDRAPWQAAMQLLAIADEASAGVGSPLTGLESEPDQKFLRHASTLLARVTEGASVCEQVVCSRVRVLPKMHTPQSGLTIRSLSLYLALATQGEVRPRWIRPFLTTRHRSQNVLVVPWPMEIHPVQFQPSMGLAGESANMPERFRLFRFAQPKSAESGEPPVVAHVRSLHRSAVEKLGRVDLIVLPECAITTSEHGPLRTFALEQGAVLVSGVGGSPSAGGPGSNQVRLDLPLSEPLLQAKHHRWKLDASQITQYGLGSILDPEAEWWEHINIEDRQFCFACITADVVLSVLICEDLARPDPVGDLVRAVGPNLVVALLMDGPQLKERWAARYATVLADDPGSSVLSITSLGMSRLSRPRDGKGRARVIALWKDAKTGGPVEIELEDGAEAVVLSLSMRQVEEWAADGRSDQGGAVYPILTGVHGVRRYTEGEAPQ